MNRRHFIKLISITTAILPWLKPRAEELDEYGHNKNAISYELCHTKGLRKRNNG